MRYSMLGAPQKEILHLQNPSARTRGFVLTGICGVREARLLLADYWMTGWVSLGMHGISKKANGIHIGD